jgi:hypothetical protein
MSRQVWIRWLLFLVAGCALWPLLAGLGTLLSWEAGSIGMREQAAPLMMANLLVFALMWGEQVAGKRCCRTDKRGVT